MNKRNEEEMREWKMELEQEIKEDELYEQRMHDIDFAIEQYEEELNEAWRILTEVSYQLSKYNHELSPWDLLKEI